jgi:hypothetical protein
MSIILIAGLKQHNHYHSGDDNSNIAGSFISIRLDDLKCCNASEVDERQADRQQAIDQRTINEQAEVDKPRTHKGKANRYQDERDKEERIRVRSKGRQD